MNVLQACPPLGRRDLTMYLRIVLVEWWTPSLMANSSAIRSSPHLGSALRYVELRGKAEGFRTVGELVLHIVSEGFEPGQ